MQEMYHEPVYASDGKPSAGLLMAIQNPCRPLFPVASSLCKHATLWEAANPLASEGWTYEKNAILEHLKQHKTSPVTSEPISDQRLCPNLAVYKAVQVCSGSLVIKNPSCYLLRCSLDGQVFLMSVERPLAAGLLGAQWTRLIEIG